MRTNKKVQLATALWVLAISAMVAASAFPSYVQHVDPAFRDLGCEGCHATGTPNSVVLKAKRIQPAQAPLIDGVADPVWDGATEIRINLTGGFNPISLPGDESWSSAGAPLPWGTANMTTVEIRALYDGESATSNVYLQVKWIDETQSTHRAPWFFNEAKGLWEQANSTLWNEDKVALFWQVGEVTGFEAGGCLVTCHATTPNRTNIQKYTPQPGDVIDMWVFRSARLNGVNQVDDAYMDYNVTSRAIHNDPQDNASLGYKTNTQTKNNGSKNMSIPLYWIPGRTDYDYILLSEIESHTAKKIVSVDASNELHDEDGTVLPHGVMVPSLWTSAADGDRGHVTGHGVHSGDTWMLEMKRSLQTSSTVNNVTGLSPNDVQFVDLTQKFYFAIAVFDNVGSGHMWHPGPYRLQFGEAATPVPSNLDVWGTSVGAASLVVSGVGALVLASAVAAKNKPAASKKGGDAEGAAEKGKAGTSGGED